MFTEIREGYPMYCAHFPGGDPRRFEPDEQGATEAELAAWRCACEAAETNEEARQHEGSAVYWSDGKGGGGMGHLECFGPGLYYYPENFFENEDDEDES